MSTEVGLNGGEPDSENQDSRNGVNQAVIYFSGVNFEAWTQMSADEYLRRILIRESVDTGPSSPVRGVLTQLDPIIRTWANGQLLGISPSGSFAKGTANHSGTDIDLFISLSEQTTESLRDIYNKLFNTMTQKGYAPKRQNVSITIRVSGYDVDLVPAKRQNRYSNDYSLYRRRADTWTKTDVSVHIKQVWLSGRQDEIRIVKLWRDQKGLDFPSFYLELTSIDALSGQRGGTLSQNVWQTFKYLRDSFPNSRVVDPANTNNIISDDLSGAEKLRVKTAAVRALSAKDWTEIVI